ncbi:MAG TPA: M14 family zinc carboxypeptidase [Bacteroidales bacterium]|nr:M14 family zinc carboxypeptidase [Bacteroidales bacterium]HQG21958.1 M14 family zinc carboxypeptidase [Bacteroidales bacterium]
MYFTRLSVTGGMMLLVALLLLPEPISATRKYSDPAAVNRSIEQLRQANPSLVKVHKFAVTPGGREMLMIEIGKSGTSVPAVLVGANFSGLTPLATEAAMSLASRVVSDASLNGKLTWYILPIGNPDAYARFFTRPLWSDPGNGRPFNDDTDDQTDEDGYNDLDGNGIITRMRVKAHDGTWVPVEGEPRLMRKADAAKGERGIYKLYTEGIDDDGDGQYNEDVPGGTNINNNFPHLFKKFGRRSGLYPGSEPESEAMLRFAFSHPEIAMVIAFGQTNYLLSPPKGGRKGSIDTGSIRIPREMGASLGIDVSRTYTLAEVIELVQPMLPPGMTADESMIASFLGLGEVVNPMPDDMIFYNEISSDYKEYLKKKGITAERLDPAQPEEGSFELWAYYHLGVPVFTIDFWGLPKPKEEKKENQGDEKKNDTVKADQQKGDPKEVAQLAFSDKWLDGRGFTPWKSYKHPTLGEVEIGGFTPFSDNTPPESMIDSLLDLQLPYIPELVKRLPRLAIAEVKTTEKGGGVYQLEAWVTNEGYLSFPIAMGKRNKVPAPAILTLEGDRIEILSGKKRTPIGEVGGMKSVKYVWLVRSPKKETLTLRLESKQAGNDSKTTNIGG